MCKSQVNEVNNKRIITFITQSKIRKLCEEAFRAGVKRGQDEMYGGTMKYTHEIKQPNFDEWYEQRNKSTRSTRKE